MKTINQIEQWIEEIGSYDPQVVESATAALILSGDTCFDHLHSYVKEDHGRKTWVVAKIMLQINPACAVPILITSIESYRYSLQCLVIELLAQLDDPQVHPLLISKLDSPNQMVQLTAVQGIRRVKLVHLVPRLLWHLEQTPSCIVRYTIIETLGDLGDPQAITTIRQFVDDNDHHVRKRAKKAVAKLNQNRAMN